MRSAPLEPEDYDCVAIVTAHTAIDYARRRRAREGRRRLPERDARASRSREGLEALSADPSASLRSGSAPGARTSSATSTSLADLAWICDASEARREQFARALPERARDRRPTTSCSPTPTLEAVVIATPVPTHYALAKQALEAGKHVFVEKPPAMRAAEMEELVALSEDRTSC